ncbi:MAG: hypothetical protein KatS3mg057_2225 [Herpetosiphonaceae bacterium]|nr:MAG: hypothetical protein KatS3mg057_2225 [Herpetosiphonaceae bacterium]
MSVGDLSERIAALPPEKRALLAKKLRQKLDRTRSQIRPQPRDTNLFPLSFGQERLWFVQELVPDSPLYNVCVAMRVNGFYDVPGLEQMISHILERHEILRTTFTSIDGQPMQVIHPPQPCKLPVVNLEHLPTEEREAEITRLIAEQAALPFDLKTGPLIRFLLIQPAHEEFVMVITANHIICDGLTMGFFIQELVTILIAYFQNQPSPLPPLPLQYADYAVWQRQWLQGEVLEEQLSYWRERLSGDLPVLDLPTDRPRPPVQTFRGDRCSLMLPRELSDRVKALAQAEGATLFTTLLAAFNILLHYYTRQGRSDRRHAGGQPPSVGAGATDRLLRQYPADAHRSERQSNLQRRAGPGAPDHPRRLCSPASAAGEAA